MKSLLIELLPVVGALFKINSPGLRDIALFKSTPYYITKANLGSPQLISDNI